MVGFDYLQPWIVNYVNSPPILPVYLQNQLWGFTMEIQEVNEVDQNQLRVIRIIIQSQKIAKFL
jgi:hypothetical protein